MEDKITDMIYWSQLMGQDLERSELQPLQPIKISKKGIVEVNVKSIRALQFSAGDRLEINLKNGLCMLQKNGQNGIVFKAGKPVKFPVSEDIAKVISSGSSNTAVLINRKGEGIILPVIVQEYPPDVLGPRFIDELREDKVIRHAIPGLSRDSWTEETLFELENSICREPFALSRGVETLQSKKTTFRIDPISIIAQGNDWVGWMTRNKIICQPATGDKRLGDNLIAEIYEGQKEDGSWETVSATGYAILRLLELGENPSKERIQRAAKWLLELPEPSPRPGMWMLTEEYLKEWLSKRKPNERRVFKPGEIQHMRPSIRINFYSRDSPGYEQDQFRGQKMQRVIPTCARHHSLACEPRITHISALVAEVLMRCGYSDHQRLRRYVNTVSHLGGEWGYWCGCGALGLYDSDIPTSENTPDFNIRKVTKDGNLDLSPWRWFVEASESVLLANKSELPEKGTHLEPFYWYSIPEQEGFFALIGTGWQNGDCWAKTNRALSQHPLCSGSLTEHLALYQASRYQTSLGEWDQGFPVGMLKFLSLYDNPIAKALMIKNIPWLRKHQSNEGLWHHDKLPRKNRKGIAKAIPPEPRLATYHIVSALHKFGLIDHLRNRIEGDSQ